MPRTIQHLIVLAICYSCTWCSAVSADLIIDWTTVGDPGNAPDPATGNHFGAVDYSFQISTHEVTNAQYAAFLNSVGSMDVIGLYNSNMEIARTGRPGMFTYSVDAMFAQRPVRYVSYMDAMRFANWLHNGQPTGNIGQGTTEAGAYTITDGLSEVRSSAARFFIPNENEWYKAAYYDARDALHFGPSFDDHYWAYPTQSEFVPFAEAPPGLGNSVNADSTVGDVTDVGAYVDEASFYGTYDQGGNVSEWNESVISDIARGVRGGDWSSGALITGAAFRAGLDPNTENGMVGLRIAAVPEPTPLLFGCLLMVAIAGWKWVRSLVPA